MPKDEDYLETTIPEMESLKAKIDAVIESHLGFIANLKTRDRILRQLWLGKNQGCEAIKGNYWHRHILLPEPSLHDLSIVQYWSCPQAYLVISLRESQQVH